MSWITGLMVILIIAWVIEEITKDAGGTPQ